MGEWFEKIKAKVMELVGKITGKKATPEVPLITTVAKEYEINLVPDVKLQMIKAQKMRNLVLFICIVVSAVSVGAVLVLFSIKGGQDIAMTVQDAKLGKMSEKLAGYDELGNLVTIQSQLEKLGELGNEKTVPSRVFGALNATLPTGGDSVRFSELRIDLETGILRLEAQADAKVAPLIDYRVLESFKKGVSLATYDYGQYKDALGADIPSWCIKESDGNGAAYKSGEDYYAWWDLTLEGCAGLALAKSGDESGDGADVSGDNTATDEEENLPELRYNADSETEINEQFLSPEEMAEMGVRFDTSAEGEVLPRVRDLNKFGIERRTAEDGSVQYVKTTVLRVKIWRTPQFTAWHKAGFMELDGSITGIEHFHSECINYSGTMQGGNGSVARWTSTNDCMLAPEGLEVTSSSNARDESDNLVLRFSATMGLAEDFLLFRNKHMMALGPMGQNVTDSYMQIGGMFTQPAHECAENDTECLNNANNSGGSN